jgi:hypothetical protein
VGPSALRVIANQEAIRLYERLGFRTIAGDGVQQLMEAFSRGEV